MLLQMPLLKFWKSINTQRCNSSNNTFPFKLAGVPSKSSRLLVTSWALACSCVVLLWSDRGVLELLGWLGFGFLLLCCEWSHQNCVVIPCRSDLGCGGSVRNLSTNLFQITTSSLNKDIFAFMYIIFFHHLQSQQ